MNSLYSFFDDTFCADDCFSYMNILVNPKLQSQKIMGCENSLTLENLTNNFIAEYKTCKCDNGKPALRCNTEVEQFCDKDGCFQNYIYNATSKACYIQDMSLMCEKTQHYVKEKNACEPNVCYCSYGEVTDKCSDHATHTCKLNTCIEGTEPIQGKDGAECTKTCKNILFMDSTWIKPLNSSEI